jgi:hypothetical protein
MHGSRHQSTKLSGTAKLDATTEAAYAIIDKRVLDRESKTAKLRALRLEMEVVERCYARFQVHHEADAKEGRSSRLARDC